jgi:hypothetical protein
MPPLSLRRPFRPAEFLLRDRRRLTAFAAETAGRLVYVAALRLAALALVQAVAAPGVAVLAFATARGHPSRFARREKFAVVLAQARRCSSPYLHASLAPHRSAWPAGSAEMYRCGYPRWMWTGEISCEPG